MNNSITQNVSLDALDLPGDLKKLTIPQCEELCSQIRDILVKTVSKNGGHLASNLGVVELTMAIHRVFRSPDDKIVWDVGHQSYTHKLLTGRLKSFQTIRKENGISGFPKPDESVHDAFISGHSSTSVSAAYGIAQAMKLSGNDSYVVAVTGDGAMTGGEIYEGLNNAGKSDANLIVVINHNEMSISKNVGALAKYLMSIRNTKRYVQTKQAVEKAITNIPLVGMPIAKVIKSSKDTVKSTVYRKEPANLFEDLGFIYLGPVDGHDIAKVEDVLRAAKTYHRPVVIHVNTIKGKGYTPAEKNPGEFHGISSFDIITGNPEVSAKDSYSLVFGKELTRLAKNDSKICAVTAAMKYGTGLQSFAAAYPDRFFDVGIAEQHAVTFSAGLASMGKLPVFAVYSSFLQRSVDQLIHDVAIGDNHVVIGIDRAGIVGEDGETHQGIFDVPLLSVIPGVTIFSPSCYEELRLCLNEALYNCRGLVCLRYPRGRDESVFDREAVSTDHYFTENGSDTLLITYGRIYDELCTANKELSCDMLKLTRIMPIDKKVIERSLKYKRIVFFEESILNGGIAERFGDVLNENGFSGSFYKQGIKGFLKQASVRSLLKKSGIDSSSMTELVRKLMETKDET